MNRLLLLLKVVIVDYRLWHLLCHSLQLLGRLNLVQHFTLQSPAKRDGRCSFLLINHGHFWTLAIATTRIRRCPLECLLGLSDTCYLARNQAGQFLCLIAWIIMRAVVKFAMAC